MHSITRNITSYFSIAWKEKHVSLLESEHLDSLVSKFNEYLNEECEALRLPYFSEEVTPPINQIMSYFKSNYERIIEYEKHSQQAWATILENAPFEYLLVILGQRLTPASVIDETAIPPLKQTLLNSCFEPYNNQICVATRAWEKHVGRHKDNFWGVIKGSPIEKNQYVKNLIVELIDNKTWWNIFGHYKHELVYEIRIKSGHGIRWNKEGTVVIGFLEPFINE